MNDDLITVYLARFSRVPGTLFWDEWEWRTGMTASELRTFWENIKEMRPYWKDIHSLPGEVVEYTRKNKEEAHEVYDGKRFIEVWTANIRNNRDSTLHAPGPIEGRYERQIVHSRYGERDE